MGGKTLEIDIYIYIYIYIHNMDGSYEFGKPYQTWLFLGIHFKISGQWCGHAVLQQVSLVCVCVGGVFYVGS